MRPIDTFSSARPASGADSLAESLVASALAINAAPTLDEAFRALADAALELVGCDRVSIVVWTPDLSQGYVRAAAGTGSGDLGLLVPGDRVTADVLATGEPAVGPPELEGLPPAMRRALGHIATVVRVPLSRGRWRASLQAGFAVELGDDEGAAAASTLLTLVRLTTVAERTEHERAVVHEHYATALFDNLPLAIAALRPETRAIEQVNRAFLDLLGYDAEDIIGRRPPYPWWCDDEQGPFEQSSDERAVERLFRRKDGALVPVRVESRSVVDTDGEPIARLALVTDLSDRARLEQQLAQSGKLAAIGELAAGVAHEINNPLFAILGLTEFLIKEVDPESKMRSRLDLIQQTGLEIKEIVRALLDFARENADERHVVALDEVVQQTVDLVRRTNAHKGVEIVDSYETHSAAVLASPNQLKQIFLNLMANARQAMPEGGTVSVDVRTEGGFAVATVVDTGPGIDPETLGRIFEPFFTTKRLTGGTGLGLSVSLGIAEAHGGSLTVESAPSHGAAFTLRLPLADADEEAA
ncbi:MAG TPA: ATP-binding protein [Gaiellaceae bacterium]